MTKIAVLGLGAMGSALAGTLLDAGHAVTVWNRTPGKARTLVQRGATEAAGARQAIAASDLVIVCLLDYASVDTVLGGAGPTLDGRVVVNLTNGTPRQAETLGEWVNVRGARYLDGGIMAVPPMIGGEHAFILYSGDAAAFELHRGTLAHLGRPVFLGADVGLAPLNDIALLAAMYGLFAGFLHAAALIRSAGRSVAAFMPLATPWLAAMASALPQMADSIDTGRHEVEGGSNLAMQAAGFVNMIEAARDQGVDPVFMEPMLALMQRRVADGFGADDISSLIELLHSRPGQS